MSLVGKAPSDLHVRIDLDLTAWEEALGRAIKATADFAIAAGPAISALHRHYLQQRRHHVRVQYRRKSRGHR
jgi:hypothetical protein